VKNDIRLSFRATAENTAISGVKRLSFRANPVFDRQKRTFGHSVIGH